MCCGGGEPFAPVGGYQIKMPKFEDIQKIRPLVTLGLCVLRAGLAAREEHDQLNAWLEEKKQQTRTDRNGEDEVVKMGKCGGGGRDGGGGGGSDSGDDNNNDDDDEINLSLSHGWGHCVPSIWQEFLAPLDSEDLALSYLMDVFGSVYKNDTIRLNSFHPKELTQSLVALEHIIRKYRCHGKPSLPKRSEKRRKKKNRKDKDKDAVDHVVHRLTGRHLHACGKHQQRDRRGLVLQHVDRPLPKKRSKSKYMVERKDVHVVNAVISVASENEKTSDNVIEMLEPACNKEHSSFTEFINSKQKRKNCSVQ